MKIADSCSESLPRMARPAVTLQPAARGYRRTVWPAAGLSVCRGVAAGAG